METSEVISKWFKTYNEYQIHCGILDQETRNKNWVDKSNILMEYWNKMVDGKTDLPNYYSSFANMLLSYEGWYSRINEDYRRNKRIDVVPNKAKTRYWK